MTTNTPPGPRKSGGLGMTANTPRAPRRRRAPWATKKRPCQFQRPTFGRRSWGTRKGEEKQIPRCARDDSVSVRVGTSAQARVPDATRAGLKPGATLAMTGLKTRARGIPRRCAPRNDNEDPQGPARRDQGTNFWAMGKGRPKPKAREVIFSPGAACLRLYSLRSTLRVISRTRSRGRPKCEAISSGARTSST
jgi:hypothetical protein